MYLDKKIIGLIPARGGSKRLPGKNTMQFNGHPLISWSIRAGMRSKYIDDIVVSTEDEDIAKISKKYGADVPFKRPMSLAEDDSTTIDVILHALEFFSKELRHYDYIFLLQPTSPLRTNTHIDESIEFFFEKGADSVIGVSEVSHPIEWASQLSDEGTMEDFYNSLNNIGSGDKTSKHFMINGAIYFISTQKLLETKSIIQKHNSFGFEMDRKYSIDIDHQLDFDYAEFISKKILRK